MIPSIVRWSIIVICFACLAIIVFAPSIYAGWFYLMSRKVGGKSKKTLSATLTTFAINLILAYALFHLGVGYFFTAKVAERDSAAREAVESAVRSQKKFFESHGRYYSVGPVRGPYKDEYGLSVKKDVILQVEPEWDKNRARDSYLAYALNVWGRAVIMRGTDGRVITVDPESEKAEKIRRKLVRSVQ
jgi:hypothetical protein